MLTNQIKNLLQQVFWDSDAGLIDLVKNKRVIIERILMFGRPEHIQWLTSNYSAEEIIGILKKSKVIDKKTANLWALHYNIDRKEISCFNRSLTNNFYC